MIARTRKGIGGDMVESVGLEYKGMRGRVKYDPKNLSRFEVEFPSSSVREKVEAYLTTERDFKIPKSPEIDDYAVESAKPTDNKTYFELALCTLWANTGVWVVW